MGVVPVTGLPELPEELRDIYREEWVAERLLEAPGHTLTREQLTALVPLPGSSGRGNGSKAGNYARKGLQVLRRTGLLEEFDDLVTIPDPHALRDWLYGKDGP